MNKEFPIRKADGVYSFIPYWVEDDYILFCLDLKDGNRIVHTTRELQDLEKEKEIAYYVVTRTLIKHTAITNEPSNTPQ